jgi:hypothetical protein
MVQPAAGATVMHAENSEVLFVGSVAVATTKLPAGTLTGSVTFIVALPLASDVTLLKPRNVVPSPLPEASQTGLEKNSILNAVLAVLLRVP